MYARNKKSQKSYYQSLRQHFEKIRKKQLHQIRQLRRRHEKSISIKQRLRRDDLDNIKIVFVTIFLNITSRYE